MSDPALITIALLGALIGAVVALVPGLHVYSIAAFGLVLSQQNKIPLANESLAMFLLGMVTSWAVVNAIPAVFLFAPDDAGAMTVMPATKLLLRGRGAEAALLVGAGSLAACVALVALAPILDEFIRPLRAIISPHLGWMLTAIIMFLLLGEWPRANDRAPTPARRLASAWAYLGAGLLTFLLSGLMGFVLMYRSPVPQEAAFQNLLPAFVGLFSLPGLIQVLAFGSAIPKQDSCAAPDLSANLLARGALTGVAGGLFAGIMPVISGGVGGLLAGHATAQRDDRLFLISQGASKVAYYAGGLLLLFVPGAGMVRGGMAWMLSSGYMPYGWRMYLLAIAGVALCGALAFVLLMAFTRGAAAITGKINPRMVAGAAMLLALAITAAFTGAGGLGVALVATLIGLIPVLVGGRRMNCLGVLLLPITLNVIGVGADVAMWLGLI